jgi:AraC-like DNA-binding protein
MRAVADKIKVPTALWEGLKRVGIARGDVVRRAQIPINVLRDGAPVTTMQFFAIWRALAELSTDPVVGIRIAVSLDGAAMPPSFLAAYYARDFRDALQRVARFKRLCAPEDVLIEERSDRCEVVLTWTHCEDEVTPSALVDASMASLLELGRRGTGERLIPLSVELARPERARAALERYYGSRVRFGSRKNRLTLSSGGLDRPFVSYNAELLEIVTPELTRRSERQKRTASFSEQIKWSVRRRLTAGRPDMHSVASELAMSERSLQRKLTDEGITFQGLLSEIRHETALEYLSDSSLEIAEVAYLVGYEDQNSFFRAFRQWEDQTPSAWRAGR